LETTAPQIVSSEFEAGGLLVGRTARIGVHGTSATDTTFRFNGLDITSALRPGTPIVMPDMVGMASLDVTRVPNNVAMNAPGPVVEWRPVDGQERIGMVEGFFSPSAFAVTPTATGPQPVSELQSFADGALVLAGAIQPGRSSAALSAHWARDERLDRSTTAGRLQQPAAARYQTSQLSLAGHVVFTPTSQDRNVASLIVQRAHVTVADASRTVDPDSSGVAQLTSQHTTTGGAVLTLSTAYQWLQAGQRAPAATLEIDSAFDGAVFPRVFSPGGKERVLRTSLEAAQPVQLGGLAHHVRVGGSIDTSSITPQLAQATTVFERVNGVPARVWRVNVADAAPHWSEVATAAYLSDRIGSDALWVDAGLRLDHLGGRNGGATRIGWTNLYAHISGEVFDARSGIGVFGSYARVGARLPAMALAWGDVNAPTASVYRWVGPDQNAVQGVIAQVGPGAAQGLTKIAPDLARPSYDVAVGGIRMTKSRLAVGVAAVVRKASGEIRAVADPNTFYSTVTQPDPNANFTDGSDDQLLTAYNRKPGSFGLDRYTLTTIATPGDNTIYALDVTAQYSGAHMRLAFSAAAVAAKGTAASRGFRADENDPMLIGDAFANPNATVNAEGGRTFFDRGYIGKMAGTFDLPARISLGVVVRYQDGQPFSRLAIFSNLNQGPEAVMAYQNGRPTRFTYISTTDMRLQRTTAFGSKQLTLIVDGFNVFNIGREVSEYVIGDTNFRQTSLIEPPRTIRIGVRIAF
jgi:hypothetical protein